jgi:hypothetical protein
VKQEGKNKTGRRTVESLFRARRMVILEIAYTEWIRDSYTQLGDDNRLRLLVGCGDGGLGSCKGIRFRSTWMKLRWLVKTYGDNHKEGVMDVWDRVTCEV